MQRVEAGRLRGRRLMSLPRGVDGLRPTAARVRGAIFDRLSAELEGARVLDLFAGSGALSIEALSRGAASAMLIDAHPRVVRFLRAQLAELGLERACTVVRAEAARHLERAAATPFDLVFVDPPFATPDVFEPICSALTQGWLADGATVVCERERIRGKTPAIDWPAGLQLQTARTYGQAVVEFLRYEQQ